MYRCFTHLWSVPVCACWSSISPLCTGMVLHLPKASCDERRLDTKQSSCERRFHGALWTHTLHLVGIDTGLLAGALCWHMDTIVGMSFYFYCSHNFPQITSPALRIQLCSCYYYCEVVDVGTCAFCITYYVTSTYYSVIVNFFDFILNH